MIDQKPGKLSEDTTKMIILENHFEEAIGLVLKQNAIKK